MPVSALTHLGTATIQKANTIAQPGAICQLPNEILEEIFVLTKPTFVNQNAALESAHSLRRAIRDPSILLVCRQWCHVALNAPAYWSTIFISAGCFLYDECYRKEESTRSLDELSKKLTRSLRLSMGTPLTIVGFWEPRPLQTYNKEHVGMSIALKALFQCCQRFIGIGWDILSMLLNMAGLIDVSKLLHISSGNFVHGLPRIQDGPFMFPNLQTLVCCSEDYLRRFSVWPCPQATYLHLISFSLTNDAIRLVNNFTAITHLHLDLVRHRGNASITFPRLLTLSSTLSAKTSLRVLRGSHEIKHVEWNERPSCDYEMHHVVARRFFLVRKITFKHYGDLVLQNVLDPRITLQVIGRMSDGAKKWFSMFPRVSEIVASPTHERDGTFYPSVKFGNSILLALTDLKASHLVICPEISRLVFNHQIFDLKVLTEFITWRYHVLSETPDYPDCMLVIQSCRALELSHSKGSYVLEAKPLPFSEISCEQTGRALQTKHKGHPPTANSVCSICENVVLDLLGRVES